MIVSFLKKGIAERTFKEGNTLSVPGDPQCTVAMIRTETSDRAVSHQTSLLSSPGLPHYMGECKMLEVEGA